MRPLRLHASVLAVVAGLAWPLGAHADDAAPVVSPIEPVPPAAVPPPDLKGRLMARLSGQNEEKPAAAEASKEEDFRPEGAFDVAPGVRAVRTDDANWIKSPFPGIEFKIVGRAR